MFDASPENILRIATLVQERARLLARLAEIDEELTSGLPTLFTVIAATSQTPLNLKDHERNRHIHAPSRPYRHRPPERPGQIQHYQQETRQRRGGPSRQGQDAVHREVPVRHQPGRHQAAGR